PFVCTISEESNPSEQGSGDSCYSRPQAAQGAAPGRYPLHRGPAAAGGSHEISGAERPRGQQAGHRTALRALPHPVPHVRFAAAVNQKLTTDHTDFTDFLGKSRSFESRKPPPLGRQTMQPAKAIITGNISRV